MSTTAAYLRVSCDKQDVARQRESIQQWAESNGFQIVHWFEDSEGRNPRDLASKRRGFQMMLEAVRGGIVKKVIVDSQDRFGTRDAYQLGEFLTLLRENGCELWSVSQGELTKDDDATILTNILGALTSTREQKEKALRNVGGKVQKAKNGEYQGGYPGYGIDVVCFSNGKEKWRVEWVGHYERWKIYPDGQREAFNGKDNFPQKDKTDTLECRPGNSERLEVVRNIFDWYATENISPGKIAVRLNNLGVPTTVGGPWYKEMVKTMLANPVYTGYPTWNKRGGGRFKEHVDGQIRDVTSKTAGRKRDRSDYIQPDKRLFPPIVDPKTWEAVQAKLAKATQPKKRPPRKSQFWLRPFLVCGRCGNGMSGRGPQPRMEYVSYICSTYNKYTKGDPNACPCHRVRHSLIETLLNQYLEEIGEGLGELVECEDSTLFDSVYSDWSKTVTKRNKLWTEMNAVADPPTTLESIWNVSGRYKPKDIPKIEAEIDAKEAELDRKMDAYAELDPALRERASQKLKALQDEIEDLESQIVDLRAPWEAVEAECHQRWKALETAATLAEEDGLKRAEALSKVVEKIVCHFRYTPGGKSILDALEFHPVSGDCFTKEVKLEQD